MRKLLLSILVPFVVWCSCTKKTYNYYLTEEMGSLAGVVEPAESGARISAWQGKEVAFTYIDSTGYFILSDLPAGTYSVKVEAEGYTTYESKIYTVYKGGGTTVGTITLKPFPDLISSVTPPDKAVDVLVYTNVLIYFNEPMNKESAIKAFSINPPVEGTYYWREYYTGVIEFMFNPSHNLLPDVTYTVTLDTTAQDATGNHLSEPFSFSFTTVKVGVESFFPNDGQTNVTTSVYIEINFNSTMDQLSVEDAFSTDPPTTGKFYWDMGYSRYIGGSHLRFDPDTYLKTNALYTVNLDNTARDTSGYPISESLSFSFTTENLNVIRTYPVYGAVDTRTHTSVAIVFNTAMDKSSAENAFSIAPAVEGDFTWSKSSTTLDFQPKSGYLAANTTYQVKIDTTASDSYGGHLSKSCEFSFTTEEVKVTYTIPQDMSSTISTYTGIRIVFNTGIDESSVVNSFSTIPGVVGSFYWLSPNEVHFYPEPIFASNTPYTITVDTSAQDLYGMKLAESYSFSFTTAPIRIISSSPKNGATYADPDANIEIHFSTDMNQASVVNAFTMIDSDSIDVNGAFSWSGLYKLVFDPDSILALNEEYSVIIATGASDIKGTNMPEEFVLWFKTRP